MMELSQRMLALTRLVPKGRRVVDVGCDHGFVSIYLYEQGICPRVIASDVRPGPLAAAREHVEAAGASDHIETRLSDGLKNIGVGEADGMIAAGMGGKLMLRILEDSLEKVRQMEFLVLQPQSDLLFFRQQLRCLGLTVLREDMIFEEGKYYPMMLVSPQGTEPAPRDPVISQKMADSFGYFLLKQRHPVLLRYLMFRETHLESLIPSLEGHPERKTEMEQELELIRSARALYAAQ